MPEFQWVLVCLTVLSSSLSAGEPAIDVWYGEEQRFGHLGGHPQRWVNILGEVSPADSIETLTFSLNDGEPRILSHREDRKRIARDGDFNIEIARTELRNGTNTITILAAWAGGAKAEKSVTVQCVQEGHGWPLPYSIDWSQVRDIQDVAQVVDGEWKLTRDGIRTVERYYDRVIAFGDDSWQDYEVTTTVTVHALTPPRHGSNGTNVTHAAIALRWPGHDADGNQPSVKWHPVGATAEFRLGGDLKQCRWRIFDGKKEAYVESQRRRALEFDRPYWMKHRVESLGNDASRYRVKCWRVGTPEPPAWDLERMETGDLPSGSALLIAHHADVTFGNVAVVPIDSETENSHGHEGKIAETLSRQEHK